MQESNLDQAGAGVKEQVLQNVRQHLPTELHEQVKIVEASSLDSTSQQVLSHTGNRPAIMFSVDACHSFHCTLNDLNLAKSTLHPDGIIMLDDVFNQEWPGVMLGLGQ